MSRSSLRLCASQKLQRRSLVLVILLLVTLALLGFIHVLNEWKRMEMEAFAAQLEHEKSAAPSIDTCSATPTLRNHGLVPLPNTLFHLAAAYNFRVPEVTSLWPPEDSRPDVGIITQMSLNRLKQLKSIATRWQGPVSVAVFVCDQAELDGVLEFYDSTLAVRKFVRLHVVVGRTDTYPINTMRNAAIKGASTPWVFVVDVDEIIGTPARAVSEDLGKAVKTAEGAQGVDMAHVAFVVPVLGWARRIVTGSVDEVEARSPLTKSAVEQLWRDQSLEIMHADGPYYRMDFEQWFMAREAYELEYEYRSEHYFIVSKAHAVPFDESFNGYGGDKVSNVIQQYCAGFRRFVLPSSWLLDIPNEKLGFHNLEQQALHRSIAHHFVDTMRARYPKCRNIRKF